MSAPSIAGYNYKHDTARGSQYKTVEVCIKKNFTWHERNPS